MRVIETVKKPVIIELTAEEATAIKDYILDEKWDNLTAEQKVLLNNIWPVLDGAGY